MSALTPWQQAVYDQLISTWQAGRLGHGLLFTGPAGIGKRAVALQMARHLLCQGAPAAAAGGSPREPQKDGSAQQAAE